MDRMWLVVVAMAAGCGGDPVCGTDEWAGFACDEEVASVEGDVDEVAAAVEEVEGDVADLEDDTGSNSGLVREWYPVEIPLEGVAEPIVWEEVFAADTFDMHLLMEATQLAEGDEVYVDGAENCRVNERGGRQAVEWPDVWTGEVTVDPDGHPTAHRHASGSVAVDCDGITNVSVPIAPYERITLVVDR